MIEENICKLKKKLKISRNLNKYKFLWYNSTCGYFTFGDNVKYYLHK